MGDIDHSEQPEESPEPVEPSRRQDDGATERKPLPWAAAVVGLLFLPGAALSATFLIMAIGDWGGSTSTAFFVCLAQLAGLVLIWRYLSKASSWGVVILGIIVAAGFYLLMLGLCAGVVSK